MGKAVRLRHRGFTLVEVVISISLTAILMVALWSLLSTYLNVSLKSERRVTKSQLARAVQQQIENDLKQVFFQPVADAEPSELSVHSALTEFDTTLAAESVTADSEDPAGSSDDWTGDSPDDLEAGIGMAADVIYQLTDSLWSQPRVSFHGNAFGLVLDHPFRAEPRRERQMLEDQIDMPEMAPPPAEFLARTIYVFVDRKEALVKGFPPGLLRVTFLPKELERIRKEATTDLFRIIEQAKPDLFRRTEFTDEWYDESQPQDARTAALERLNRSFGRSPVLEHDFANRIDYLPEVQLFRLRFYDGFSWSDESNAKSNNQLPVAVELSFEIDMDLPLQFEDDIARLAETEFTVEDLQAEEAAEAEAAKAEFEAVARDDSIRSAQTTAYVPPNQFIIFLGLSRSDAEKIEPAESPGFQNNQNDSNFDDEGEES